MSESFLRYTDLAAAIQLAAAMGCERFRSFARFRQI